MHGLGSVVTSDTPGRGGLTDTGVPGVALRHRLGPSYPKSGLSHVRELWAVDGPGSRALCPTISLRDRVGS